MRNRRIASIIVAVLGATLLFAWTVPAFAADPDVYLPQWGIGGSGFTHRNAMSQAMQIANSRGAGWVDSIAVDRSVYPDVVFKDNIDHNYNHFGGDRSYYNSSWGSDFGNPQGKVQMYYNAAVADLRAGDRIGASKNIGYMSHYLIDINGPLHTEESNAYEGNGVHTNLEESAANVGGGTMSYYIHPEAYQRYGGHSSPSSLTVANANSSHGYYRDLVTSYHADGFSTHVRNIEGVNFNRGVNSIANLIESAWNDADQVTPVIQTPNPTASTEGSTVVFTGYGVDSAGHAIQQYDWRWEGGPLSTNPSFGISSLPIGIHAIYFRVCCSGPKWSGFAWTPFVVGAPNTKPLPVYRFYSAKYGSHFYTAGEAEKNTVLNTMGSVYALEGVGYALDTSSTANVSPLYRFYNFKKGVHFYTSSEVEKDRVIQTMADTYNYEGPAFNVSLTPEAGTQAVYRFFNMKNGVHFYTSSVAEKDSVRASLGHIYQYEGEAYYFDPPW